MPAGMALDIDRHGKTGNVAGQKPDMDGQGGRPASQTLGAYSEFIDHFQEFDLKPVQLGIRIRAPKGTE